MDKTNLPLETYMETAKMDIYNQNFRKVGSDPMGQPIYEYGVENWVAYAQKKTAEGHTPREAAINLLEKLDML